MNRRQLEYFLTSAERGSISAAALALGVTQPAISQAIRAAEKELGVPLLRRHPRGVEPTEHGRRLMGPATQVIRGHQAVEAIQAESGSVIGGTLGIACPRSLAQHPLAPIVGEFRRRYPNVLLHIHRPQRGAGVEEVLNSGRAEVGIGVRAPYTTELTAERFIEQRVVALVPPDISVIESMGLREILTLGLVTTPRGGATRILLEQLVGANVIAEATRVETEHQGAMIPLVMAGTGVAFVSQFVGEEARRIGAQVSWPSRDLRRVLWIVHDPRSQSPAGTAFVNLAKQLKDENRLDGFRAGSDA